MGPTASSFRDHGRSLVDRQAPGRVYASGEDVTQIMEVAKEVREPPRKATRSARKTSKRSESLFLAPPMVVDATSTNGRIAADTNEVRRRRVGGLARGVLVSGFDGFQGKEEEDYVDHSPGSFRRTGEANKDELSGERQRRTNEARLAIDVGCDEIVQPERGRH